MKIYGIQLMTCSKTHQSLLDLFYNFSQGSNNKINNQKHILHNKFMPRNLCQNLQFVIRSELKLRSILFYSIRLTYSPRVWPCI